MKFTLKHREVYIPKIYSGLTGESLESLKENAGYTKRDL